MWVILAITGVLLVLSLALFFAARKKGKTFGIYFFIPICIALGSLYGFCIGLNDELAYQKASKERQQEILNFATDYQYYLESYKSILDYYDNLDSYQKENLFKNDYNLEPTLDTARLQYDCRDNDTFQSYFYRHYPVYRDYSYIEYNIKDDHNNIQGITFYVYAFSGTGGYSTPNFISPVYSDGSYQDGMDNLNSLQNYIKQGISLMFYGQDYLAYTPFNTVEYIIIIVYIALISIFDLLTMIVVFVKGGKNYQMVSAINDFKPRAEDTGVNIPKPNIQNTIVETPPPPPRPTWEELSADEQKPYLEDVIRVLFEGQLKDPTLSGLTRQQIAMREYSLQNKQFYFEDLTEIEAMGVKKIAKENYDSGKSLIKTQAQNVEIPQESNKSIIKGGFKWFIYNMMIATRERQLNTKTTTFKSNGYGGIALEQKDNSNKASLIRPCGKCMSVSGEKPLDYIVGFNPFKKVFYCCGVFKGFSFANEDILQYRMLSSNSKSEKYELIHKTGKKIIVSFNPVGSELLNAVLGADKFIG